MRPPPRRSSHSLGADEARSNGVSSIQLTVVDDAAILSPSSMPLDRQPRPDDLSDDIPSARHSHLSIAPIPEGEEVPGDVFNLNSVISPIGVEFHTPHIIYSDPNAGGGKAIDNGNGLKSPSSGASCLAERPSENETLTRAYLAKFPAAVIVPFKRSNDCDSHVAEQHDKQPKNTQAAILSNATVSELLGNVRSDSGDDAEPPDAGSGQPATCAHALGTRQGLTPGTAATVAQAVTPQACESERVLPSAMGPDNDSAAGYASLSASSRFAPNSTRNTIQTESAASTLDPRLGSKKRNYSRKLRINRDDYLTNFRSPIHASYVIKAKIGTGSWGAVHLAIERSSGYLRAIKKVPKRVSVDLKRFRQEMTILKGFDHPRIVRVYETFEDFANLYMVMEYCQGGELFERMVEEGPMPEPIAAWLMKQILSSVAYCHLKGVCHRDLKPENFLFLERDIRSPLKLLDFGLAKRIAAAEKMSSAVGTIYYLAPELLTGRYDRSVDCWSAGIIMYILLYGAPPFQADTDTAVLRMIRDGNIDYTARPVSSQAKDLIRSLCCRDPARRLLAKDALDHAWFKTQWPPPLLNLRSLLQLSPQTAATASDRGTLGSLQDSEEVSTAQKSSAVCDQGAVGAAAPALTVTGAVKLSDNSSNAENSGAPSVSPLSVTPQREASDLPSNPVPSNQALIRVTTCPTDLSNDLNPVRSATSLSRLPSASQVDYYCCDFAELQCGHSKKCPRNAQSLFPSGTCQQLGGSNKLWARRHETEPPDQKKAEEPHFAGALTHLKKLGLQNPEEAAQLADRLVEKWRHYAALTPLKRAILSLAAQQLEYARELSYIRAIFDLLDTGGDGVLTTSELTQSLTTLRSFNSLPGAESVAGSGTPGFKSPRIDDAEFATEVGALADYVDLDGNGQIEYSEFAAACLDPSTYQNPNASRAIFRVLDRDGDGRIGQGELRSALGWHDPDNSAAGALSEDKYTSRATHGGSSADDDPVAERQSDHDLIDQLVAEADIDGDGFIGTQDFQRLLEADDDADNPTSRLYDAADLQVPSDLSKLDGSNRRDQFDFSEVTRKMSSYAQLHNQGSSRLQSSAVPSAIAPEEMAGGPPITTITRPVHGCFTEEVMQEIRDMKLERMRDEMRKSLKSQYTELGG